MKKVKFFALFAIIAIVAVVGITKVHAYGYVSTLNMPYGTMHNSKLRLFGAGKHYISAEIDGINTPSGLQTSGTSTMATELIDNQNAGRVLARVQRSFIYGTCTSINFGYQARGWKHYDFFTSIYNWNTESYDNYNGFKSNKFVMYPYTTP